MMNTGCASLQLSGTVWDRVLRMVSRYGVHPEVAIVCLTDDT